MPPTADLRHYVQTFDDALDRDFCVRMVESFHAMERFHTPNGRGYRAGLEQSAWTELDITPLADEDFKRLFLGQILTYLARYNASVGLTIPVPPSPRISELVIKRYRPGYAEHFQPHFDSIGTVANRYLVFLWYLNDVAEGGETAFVDLGVEVRPAAGRLLMFPPYWMFQHEGRSPQSGDKYILSTYLLF